MRGHRHEILPGRADIGAQRAAHPHLPGAEHAGERERRRTPPRNARGKAAQRCAQETLPSRSRLELIVRQAPARSPTSRCGRGRNIRGRASGDRRVRVNSVCTCATKPGTTMVLTFVPVIRRPWITSGEAKRSVTRRPWRHRDAARHEHELGRDHARRHAAVARPRSCRDYAPRTRRRDAASWDRCARHCWAG